MDKVKAAVNDFTGRSGHHDTTVHEKVAPEVVHETVKPHQHENVTTAVDKEVHQDHYHQTVQPVHDRQVLPEKHTANLGAVQHREYDHRDHDSVKRSLANEQAQFKDQRKVEGTTHSQSVAPTVGGEHVHHHIHETIQPVVHKETVQPNVVHTTVPIHEVHHNKAIHHNGTALPAMTMDEFKHKGGVLGGREERHDEFEGVPKNIGGGSAGGFGSVRDTHGTHPTGAHGTHPTGAHGTHPTGAHGTHHTGAHGTTGTTHGAVPVAAHNHGAGIHGNTLTDDKITSKDHHNHANTTAKKPSLLDKLNPKKDTDGDGKAGIFD